MNGSGAVDQQLFPNFAQARGRRRRGTATTRPSRRTPSGRCRRSSPAGSRRPAPSCRRSTTIRRTCSRCSAVRCRSTCTRPSPRCARSRCARRAPTTPPACSGSQDLGNDAYHLWRDFASPHETTVNFSENSVVQWGLPQMHDFVRSLQPGKGPRLDFVHIELPHEPWHLLSTLQDTEQPGAAAGREQARVAEGRVAGRERASPAPAPGAGDRHGARADHEEAEAASARGTTRWWW